MIESRLALALALLTSIISALSVQPAHAQCDLDCAAPNVYCVPGAYPTIGAAVAEINAAGTAAWIQISAGTYDEVVDVDVPPYTLRLLHGLC